MVAAIPTAVVTALLAASSNIVVVETTGPDGARVAEILFQVASTELGGFTVSRQPRPGAWATTTKLKDAIAATAHAHSVAVVFDSTVYKKRRVLVMTVVAEDGTLVYSGSAKLRKMGYEPIVRNLAIEAVAAAKRHLSPDTPATVVPAEPTAASDASSPAATSTAGPTATVAPTPEPSDVPQESTTSSAPDATVASPSVGTDTDATEREDGAFVGMVQLGGGISSYRDEIVSNGGLGRLDINTPSSALATLSVGIQSELRWWTTLRVLTARAQLSSTSAGQELTIDTTLVGGSLSGGYRHWMGDAAFGIALGVSYEDFGATAQPDALLVPSWRRITLQGGVTLDLGRLQTHGWEIGLSLLGLPWGNHAERPGTSGNASTLLGGRAEMHGRYRLPFGNGWTPYIEVGGTFEQLSIDYTGAGSRILLDGITPAQGAKETRRTMEAWAAIGVRL